MDGTTIFILLIVIAAIGYFIYMNYDDMIKPHMPVINSMSTCKCQKMPCGCKNM